MPRRVRQRSSRSVTRCGRVSRLRLARTVCLIPLLVACGSEGELAKSGPMPPVVNVNGETLQGEFLEVSPPIAVFKGIPYAAPPKGELRWRPPAPISPREGLQQATDYGPACMQPPDHVPEWYRYLAETFEQDPALVPELEPISEDCLNLNVWSANLEGSELWPVLVWIHGGGNTSGSPAETPYDGATLTRKGAVVVSFNYRLNVFGFLAHPALTAESEHGSSGNYALLDQIAALQWVQNHIAAFGGDPERVTVFGESAGATNIAYLMSSPLARGHFQRAIMQSGGYAVREFRDLAEVESIGEGLVAAVGVTDSAPAPALLRALDADDLLRAAGETFADWASVPNVDGWVLEEAPGRVFEAGRQAAVPLLIGFNEDEWTTLGHYGPAVTLEGLRQSLHAEFGELVDRAIELYPASTDDEAVDASNAWQTDTSFACPSRFIADQLSRSGNKVFFDQFTREAPGPGGARLGAYHGAETAYVTDNLALEPWVPRDATDQHLADVMSDYWVRFAAEGNPNGDDTPEWPVYTPGGREYLILGDRIEPGSGIRTNPCDLYDVLLQKRLEAVR
jgi:para-nitrobenzyl esterase